MLRTYKMNGKLWRFEEGEQPESAVLVGASKPKGDTPEKRAAKAPAKRRAAPKKPAKGDDAQ